MGNFLERAAIGGLVGGPAGVVAESVIGRPQEEVPAGVEEAAPESCAGNSCNPASATDFWSQNSRSPWQRHQGQGQEDIGPEISRKCACPAMNPAKEPRPSTEMLPVEDILVDPERFQYKRNAHRQGRHKPKSLQRVEEFEPGHLPRRFMSGRIRQTARPMWLMVITEGSLQRGPAPGVIESKYIKAATAEEAKFRGALINIANKQGTAG